jgi:hypothetical protein
MFQWSKKVVKSVAFNPGVADESLLALVESYLDKDPDKTFSDLCKEALWQSLGVPESVRPNPITTATLGVDHKISELQNQLADLEERFFAKESNRLEIIESQLMQLSQQVAQIALMIHHTPIVPSSPTPSKPPVLEVVSSSTPTNTAAPPQEVDPVISRISQFLDDF